MISEKEIKNLCEETEEHFSMNLYRRARELGEDGMDSLNKMRKIVIQSVKEGKTAQETFEAVNYEFGMLFEKYDVEQEYKKWWGKQNGKMDL